MGSGVVEACEKCSKKCVMIHQGRKDPSSIVTPFFKIMLGDRFSTLLFIPPVYARSIATLDNQVIILEDAMGEQWKVKLAKVDGSLAISKGWNDFVIDHSIKLGDFLVFSYLADTFFQVQIFESTGCEKLSFSAKTTNNFNNNTNCTATNNNGGKRVKGKRSFGDASRDRTNSSSSKFPAGTAGNCSVHEQGSNSTIHSRFDDEMRERRKSANDTANVKMAAEKASDNHNKEKTLQPATQVECTEVPFYMFDRSSDKQGTSTSPLFDLSNFERPITESGMNAAQKTAPVALEKATSSHPSTDHEMEEQNHVFDEEAVCKNRGNSGLSVGIPVTEVLNSVNDLEMFERNFYVENQDKVPVLADATEEMLALVDIPSVEVPNGVYDLEMPEGNCNSENQDEVQVHANATEEREGFVLELDGLEMREQYHVVDEKPGKNGENNVPPVDIPAVEVRDSAHDFELPERKDNAENEDKIPLAADELAGYCNVIKQPLSTPAVGFCESERENLKISNAASFKEPLLVDELNAVVLLGDHRPQESSRRVTRFSSSLPPGSSKNPVAMEVKDHQTVKVSKVVEKEREKKLKEKQGRHTTFVKAEPEEFEYEACTAVKTENIDYNSPLSLDAVNFSTSAPAETQSYLELALDLPWFAVRGRKPSGKRIVVLRDSSMRKWPVVYQERSSFRVLASGWKALAEANNLQKGDICLMSVENASEGLLQLEIKRK
ncbi:uncharacterized protein LOC113300340 isoform X2 [Papaver somniferum]|uniref:uncharacterized protein LOC113300340 isoform X2 n=1 Tax=Papaver somniferum TaxID=3469 RepID=UPI000E6FF7EB|nr:uncharacterized protein LOC113300340 isoform X2 [Papaver somniferum]